MRADGLVNALPGAAFAIQLFHLQRARGDLVELLGVGAVGAFDGAIEFGRARGRYEQVQAALLAGEFELGGELGTAIDLHRPDRKGHAVLQGVEKLGCGLGGGPRVPRQSVLVRGTARLEPVDGIVPEYAAAADRYFQPEQARAWLAQLRTRISSMVRVTITPEWVGLLDFKTRFPSAIVLNAAKDVLFAAHSRLLLHGAGELRLWQSAFLASPYFPPQREPRSAIEDCGQHQQRPNSRPVRHRF